MNMLRVNSPTYILSAILIAFLVSACSSDSTNVTGQNSRPAATSQNVTTMRNTPVTITLAANDPDGGSLTFSISEQPNSGTLSAISSAGSQSATVVYTPNADFTGLDQFRFRVSDGENSARGTVRVEILNMRPTASAAEARSPRSGGPVVVNLQGADADGDPLTFEILSQPILGTLQEVVQTGPNSAQVTYMLLQPIAPNQAPDVFSFRVSDGNSNSDVATASVRFNLLPVVPSSGTLITTTKGVSTDIQLATADPEGDVLDITIVSGPQNGTLSGLPALSDGTVRGHVGELVVTYTPDPGFFGSDQIVYTLDDGFDSTDPVTLQIQVTNGAPTTQDEDAQVSGGGESVTIPLTGSDPDGDDLTFEIVTPPTQGTLGAVTSTGSTSAEVVYTADANAFGADGFTFRVTDGDQSAEGTVSIMILNSAPTDILTTGNTVAEGEPIGTVIGFLSAVDADAGDTHIFTLVPGVGATDNALIQLGANQLLTAAVLDFETKPVLSVRVRADDGRGGVFEKILIINVTNVNEAPTSFSLSSQDVDEGQPVGTPVGTFTTQDPDDPDTHTYTLVAGTGDTDNAQFQIVGGQLQTNGVFFVTVQSLFSVRVRTTDAGGLSTEAVFAITANDINLDPTDIDLDNANVDENLPAGTAVGNLTTTDPDPGDTHTYALVAGAGDTDNVQFQIAGGQLQTAGPLDFEAGTPLSVRIQTDDGNGGTYEEVFSVAINDINEVPVLIGSSDLSYQTIGNTSLEVAATQSVAPAVFLDSDDAGVLNLLENYQDPEGDPLTTSLVGGSVTAGASVTVNADGTFDYTPPVGRTADDTFDFMITDGITAPVMGTATVQFSNMVWYVNNLVGGPGTGLGSDPFSTLAGAEAASSAGEIIFLYTGDAGTTGQSDGITLKNDQSLIGETAGLSVDVGLNGNAAPTVVLAPVGGLSPRVTNTAGDAVTLANNNTVRKLFITAPTGDGIDGAGITDATILELTVADAGESAIELSGATGAISLTSLAFNASLGPSLNIVGGDPTITTSGVGILSNAAGGGIRVAGGSPILNFSGSITNSVDGRAVEVSSTAGGSVTLMTGPFTDSGAGLFFDGAGGPVSLSGFTITNPTATAVTVQNNTASVGISALGVTTTSQDGIVGTSNTGTFTVTSGSVSTTGGTALDIDTSVLSLNLSTVSVDNSLGGGGGVALDTNTGSTTLAGVDITTTTGAGLHASSAGTLFVNGNGNTISSTTGTALDVTSTTVGPNGGLRFESISADGATNGIVFTSTGSTAGLIVTGTGSTDGSGGTIENTTSHGVVISSAVDVSLSNMIIGDGTATAGEVPDATNNVAGAGISIATLSSSSGAAQPGLILDNILIARTGGDGIVATGLTGMTMADSRILNAGDGVDDRGMEMITFLGTATMTDVIVDGSSTEGLAISNTGAGALGLTVMGSSLATCSFSNSGDSAVGSDGVFMEARSGANITALIDTCTFDRLGGNGVHGRALLAGSSRLDLTVQDSRFIGCAIGDCAAASGSGNGVLVRSEDDSLVDFDILDNTISANLSAIAVSSENGSIAAGNITGNMIGTMGVANSGSITSSGIFVQAVESSSNTVFVDGNTVYGTEEEAFNSLAGSAGASPSMNVTLTGNTFGTPDGVGAETTLIRSTDTATLCLDARTNTIAAGSGGLDAVFLDRSDSSVFNIERLTLGLQTGATAAAHFAAENPGAGTVFATAGMVFTGVADGSCALPS